MWNRVESGFPDLNGNVRLDRIWVVPTDVNVKCGSMRAVCRTFSPHNSAPTPHSGTCWLSPATGLWTEACQHCSSKWRLTRRKLQRRRQLEEEEEEEGKRSHPPREGAHLPLERRRQRPSLLYQGTKLPQ